MAEKTERGNGPPARARRLQLAQVLALVALVAALVGALGPADDLRTTYSWPPAALPEGTPASAWYTPLLLIRHRPEAIAATLPCSLPPALPNAARPTTVLATARHPESRGGLAITQAEDRLLVTIGRDLLTTADLSATPAADGACAFSLRLAGRRWTLDRPGLPASGGELERMPVVSALFSALDLRQDTPPSIRVTTVPHATRPLLRQRIGWTLAVVCALTALALVAIARRPRPGLALRGAAHAVRAHVQPADAVVALVLIGWWVLSPVALDDGWVIARERMYESSGGFNYYYTDFGANLPNDFWLEWAQHWLAESSLLAVRVPALLCLAAVWVLCRWILTRVLTSSVGGSRVALWALASSFLIGALAWGMTVRPEPVTALFVTAVLACTVRFLERPSAAPLAVVAAVIPFALSGHHAAVVAFAPLLVAAPALLRWARGNVSEAAAIIASSLALLAVLLFVGADLDQRRAEAVRSSPAGETGHPWADEISRYALLSDMPPLRRASVALMALALLAFVVRRRVEGRRLLDLPAMSLAVGLVLLIATPSKLPWHFGALLGIAAIAAAAETARLREEARRSRGWHVKPVVAVGAALLAIAWSWSAGRSWGVAELRTLDWTLAFEKSYSLATLAAALPVVLLGGLGLVALARGRKDRLPQLPYAVAALTAALLALPLIAFTGGILAVDAAKSSWTIARQNLGTVAGGEGCGLADDLVVALPSSARPLEAETPGGSAPTAVPAWVPPAPVEGLPRFALGPVAEGSTASSPWFALPEEVRVGLFVSGRPTSSDRLEVEWGRFRDGGVLRLDRGKVSSNLASEAGAMLSWWFVAERELPLAPSGANAVRVTYESDATPGAAIAATAPVTYATEPLRDRLDRSAASSLVFTDLLTYFPCVQLPRLHDGIVDVPDQLVVTRAWPSPIADPFTSPFAGVLDLYRLERLPLADSESPPNTIAVFGLERRIPGALFAPAETT
jgi:hypothetical protein